MRTCSVSLFKFAELTAEAQAKAIDACRQFGVEDSHWYQFTFEDAKEIGRLLGVTIERIYFSGFSSQGDGACFEGSYEHGKDAPAKIRQHAPLDAELHRIADALEDIQRRHPGLTATLKHTGRYYHDRTVSIEVLRPDEAHDGYHAEPVADELGKEVAEELRALMRWIYRALEREYEYLTSDEGVREMIGLNDWEFTAAGKFH